MTLTLTLTGWQVAALIAATPVTWIVADEVRRHRARTTGEDA